MDLTKEKVGEFLRMVGGIDETHIDNLNNLVKDYIKKKKITLKPFELPSESKEFTREDIIKSRMESLIKNCAIAHKRCVVLVEDQESGFCLGGENPYKETEHGAARWLADFISEQVRKMDSSLFTHAIQMAGTRLIPDVRLDSEIRERGIMLNESIEKKGYTIALVINGVVKYMTDKEWDEQYVAPILKGLEESKEEK